MDDLRARELVARIDVLLEQVQDVELVQSLVDLYGEGLARIVAHDPQCVAGVAGDELVSYLLLLHGLHPIPVEDRVRAALADVRPYLEQHGGDVELLGIDGGVARLRLQGTCNGCPSSTATLKHAIDDAIQRAAPDIERIEAEGAAEPVPPGLLQIEMACPPALHGH
jgi:Fe-S cluster biogenesis protein NfuA